MSVGVVPADNRFKSRLAGQVQESRGGGWCGLECGEKFNPGDSVYFARWGTGPDDWARCHVECYDVLPEQQEVPYEGPQETTVDNSDKCAETLPWWIVDIMAGKKLDYQKLPDGRRHNGRRYIVRVGGRTFWQTGREDYAVGVVECFKTPGVLDHV